MALESFPRLRNKDFEYRSMLRVPKLRAGRMDLIVGDNFGAPMMYKAIAAYSRVVNPTAARPGIRVDSDALRNELILRGVPEEKLDATIANINEIRTVGDYEWRGYGDNTSGVISDVEADTIIMVPEMNSMFAWAHRYANLKDVSEE